MNASLLHYTSKQRGVSVTPHLLHSVITTPVSKDRVYKCVCLL